MQMAAESTSSEATPILQFLNQPACPSTKSPQAIVEHRLHGISGRRERDAPTGLHAVSRESSLLRSFPPPADAASTNLKLTLSVQGNEKLDHPLVALRPFPDSE